MTADRDRNLGFLRLRHLAEQVADLRHQAWRRLLRHLFRQRAGWRTASVDRAPRLCILASSSRGGTSVTAEMLQWQGAAVAASGQTLLTMPGEEKPFLVLSGLAFPTRPGRFDDLEPADATGASLASLMRELSSEVGHPMAYCDDLELYALQIYRRLLLQWPLQLVTLNLSAAVATIAAGLRRAFPSGYLDTGFNRRLALASCCTCFPFMSSSFYDCGAFRNESDLRLLDQGAWSFEEPPFVFPPPWHNPDNDKLAHGTVLLRDPSNAWRLPFWRAVFPRQEMHIVHLVRDVKEVLQGLCDGWNYGFGFQTMPSHQSLRIPGYTDRRGSDGTSWKSWRLNFSIDRHLSDSLLAAATPMSLVEVCAYQWRHAHEQILEAAAKLTVQRTVTRFSDLRQAPLASLREICAALGLEPSSPGVEYARTFSSHWVMASGTARQASHARWRQSPYATEIMRAAASDDLAALSLRLGLATDRIAPEPSALEAAAQEWHRCEPA